MNTVGVTGVVLCGGESRRMGIDKGELMVGEQALVDCAVSALEPTCEEVVLACGAEPKYSSRGLRMVLDTGGGEGPLEGIAATLESTGCQWLLVLACDLPRVLPEVPAALLACAQQEGLDACLFESRRGREPLMAVYRRSCLRPIRQALSKGLRRVDSFHAFERKDSSYLKIGFLHEEDLSELARAHDVAVNLNTPLDLADELVGKDGVVL